MWTPKIGRMMILLRQKQLVLMRAQRAKIKMSQATSRISLNAFLKPVSVGGPVAPSGVVAFVVAVFSRSKE